MNTLPADVTDSATGLVVPVDIPNGLTVTPLKLPIPTPPAVSVTVGADTVATVPDPCCRKPPPAPLFIVMLALLVSDELLSIVTAPCACNVNAPVSSDVPEKLAELCVTTLPVAPEFIVRLFNAKPMLLIATVPAVLALNPCTSVLIGVPGAPMGPVPLVIVKLLDTIEPAFWINVPAPAIFNVIAFDPVPIV